VPRGIISGAAAHAEKPLPQPEQMGNPQ
jgi:hypothetical protein